MRKLILLFFGILLFCPFVIRANTGGPVNIYFFYGEGCPRCAAEETFLSRLESENRDKIKIFRYETWHNQDNVKILKQFADAYGANISGVPATFIGDRYIIGFDNAENKGAEIEAALEMCLASGNYKCPGDDIIKGQNSYLTNEKNKQISTVFDLPFIGQKDLKEYSLPILAVIIGTLDGFNPCAMWVLVFLITLLLGMQERWKMWLLGGTFILASGAVYFLFMTAWLNFLMFLGFVWWIKIGIGIFGVISGILFLREYWKNRQGVCKVVNTDSRKKIFERLKDIVKNPNLLLALGGIILLAFAVNLVELACSLGFPAIFTQLLSLAKLATWQYYGYIFVYLIFFMLDDLVVFCIAMLTLKLASFSGKYTKYSNLIGGVLILIIGLLLIFKPEWLSFS